jgi:hypothetical protein
MTGARPPVDLDDAMAIVAYGADALDEGLDARLSAALHPDAAASLVAQLDQLRRAIQGDAARAARRGAGLLGRLWGRDVRAEADAAQLREQVGVLLLRAGDAAGSLARNAAELDAVTDALRHAIERIDLRIGQARDWLDANPQDGLARGPVVSPRERLEQRLAQLATVRQAWSLGLTQASLVREQLLGLLARHQRIRDVLVPTWRQHALGGAAAAGSRQAAIAARAQADIEAEVAAMAGTLDPDTQHAPE